MTENTELRLAVDIGGTFTDTVLVEGRDRVLGTAKTLTTHANPSIGAAEGVDMVLEEAGIALSRVTGMVHGTTLATNALISRKGARVATVTTGGFRDILKIAYERRYSQYDIDIEKPDLIVPRARAFTVPERVSVEGKVLTRLDESAVPGLLAELDASGAEAVAICFLHAYANPVHEIRLREILLAECPGLAISLSHEVSPEAREFDRLCTTIANAYVQPLMAEYLAEFADRFARKGLGCPILMMTAGAGMTTVETAARLPIRLVESGPAGGAILAARVARQCGAGEVLSFDMGGTTAKLCLIDGYKAQTARHFEIARAERFVKGSGMPVRIPVVEMIEIGAGGGSIASVDRLGRLTIGPESAGSEPGPAAFGKGGTRATVTDADITLGLIDPALFAEGRLAIDEAKAGEALARDVGAPLALSAGHAAAGVSEIVDENMAAAGRMHAVESGKDLARRTMIAFGGNGPLHATRVARRAGVGHVIVPPDPGVGSAVGFLHAPVSFEIIRSQYAALDSLDLGAVNRLFAAMEAEATSVVRAGAPEEVLEQHRSAYMRYRGQGHEIEIALPSHALTEADLPALQAAFDAEYARQFSRTVPGMRIEILNWAIRLTTPDRDVPPVADPTAGREARPRGRRQILCDVTGDRVEAAVFWRPDLRPGDRLTGPALIAEPQTTTFVSADFAASVDGAGNLHLIRKESTT
ncbi:hydantoinase/oxoprolinase family protein [Rhodobacteraceae bacterium NNCM2]|nr:hydantoinase/oxoprolinase family protein [Coraliihabitans acroporae]